MITLPRILFAGAVLIALTGYLFVGSPGLPDQPITKRAEELAARDPSELTGAEMLARLERMTQTRPDDPEPHFFIGQFLMNRGREPDAVRAFQSALRRDANYVPALVGLGDAFVSLSNGSVGPEAQQLYAEAYGRDPSQLRAGFRAGLAFWQSGNSADALRTWSAIEARLPDGSPEQARWREQVASITSQPPDQPESRSSIQGD
ncbi:MAG: tetratricopeptide repeat protein [Pseudomonadota bacterium]